MRLLVSIIFILVQNRISAQVQANVSSNLEFDNPDNMTELTVYNANQSNPHDLVNDSSLYTNFSTSGLSLGLITVLFIILIFCIVIHVSFGNQKRAKHTVTSIPLQVEKKKTFKLYVANNTSAFRILRK